MSSDSSFSSSGNVPLGTSPTSGAANELPTSPIHLLETTTAFSNLPLKRARTAPLQAAAAGTPAVSVASTVPIETLERLAKARAENRTKDGFECDMCQKVFGYKQHLQTHIKTVHMRIKPHKCPTCQKSFGEKSALTKHIRTVHARSRPFQCPRCSASFGQKAHLKKHQQSKFGCTGKHRMTEAAAGATSKLQQQHAALLQVQQHDSQNQIPQDKTETDTSPGKSTDNKNPSI